jgi:F420H(2)-dependent quinone reductase
MPTLRDRANKAISGMHQKLYRRSRGRFGGHMKNAPVLVLTTRGRKSGQFRSVPLIYLEDGDRWLLVASNAGQDHQPAWYLNLLDQPLAEVRIGDQDIPVKARPLAEAERAEAWPKLLAMYPDYAGYTKRTDRVLPVLALTRR